MAVTDLCGFETGADVEPGGSFQGTIASSTGQARTGARSIRVNPSSGQTGYYASANTTTGWVHFGLYVASLPSATRAICGAEGGFLATMRLTSGGYLQWGTALGGYTTGTSPLQTGQWYWIGVRWGDATGATVVVQVDGAANITTTGSQTAGSNYAHLGCAGTEASAIDLYFDDFIIDNAGFLAPSKVALLYPANDGIVQLWSAGAGGTTNLWDGIDNIPPAGVASASETDTTNIESSAKLADAPIYTTNLSSYQNAGITLLDTILAVVDFIRHGEDINTGTKLAQFIYNGNPSSVAGWVSFTFGDDAGAHAAEAGNWKTKLGELIASPTITTFTAGPSIRIDKEDTTTRTGCIDFVGVYVAWTPFVPPPKPRRPIYPQLLAH